MAPDTSISAEMEELLQTIGTQNLELAYEKSIRQYDIACETENVRQVKLRVLLLEHENDGLHTQIAQGDDRAYELECVLQDSQSRFDEQCEEMERLHGELRAAKRNLEMLRTEAESLHRSSTDSTKLLADKLSLSRELASLRPEMDHLRAQVTSNQALLAEKLALQRQLSAVEVELENEKRASQRVVNKDDGNQAYSAKLEAQLETLQSELSKERRERQRAEREAQRLASEFDGKKTVLESRVDTFRNKLRMTKEQLKEAQDELQSGRLSAPALAQSLAANTRDLLANSRNPRKRSLAQLDSTIGTPGDSPAAKKAKRGSTLPGDKSTFSITPFLNRTMSIAPESPVGEPVISNGNTVEGEPDSEQDDHAPKSKSRAKSSEKVHDTGKKAEQERPARVAKSGKGSGRSNIRKSRPVSSLDRVAEENENENEMVDIEEPSLAKTKKAGSKASILEDREEDQPVLKKKRKVLSGGLGRTLFDEDESGPARATERRAAGGATAFLPTTGRVGLGSIKFGPNKGAAPSVAFGSSFSPLKKDRKLTKPTA